MKLIRWQSRTGNNNVLKVGWENILKEVTPPLPSGGSVTFTLRKAIQECEVGKIGGRVCSDGDWFDLIVTSVSTTIEMTASVGYNNVVVEINDVNGSMTGDVPFDDLIIYEEAIDESGVPELLGAECPFRIDIARSDNIFSPIHISTGYISFIGSIEDLSHYATSDPLQHIVNFYVNGSLEWRGFVKCETLSSSWYGGRMVNKIPVISPLGILEGMYPSAEIDDLGFKTFAQLILDINNLSGYQFFERFVFPARNVQCLQYKFMMSLFCEYSNEEEKFIPESYHSILSAICDLMGWQVQEHGDTLLFLANDSTSLKHITENNETITYNYVMIDEAGLEDYNQGATPEMDYIEWDGQNVEYLTTEHTISIHQGVSSVTVKGASSPVSNPVVDVFDDRYMVAGSRASYEASFIEEDSGDIIDVTEYYNRGKESKDQYHHVKLLCDSYSMRTRNGLTCMLDAGETWNSTTQRYDVIYREQNNLTGRIPGSKAEEFALDTPYPRFVTRSILPSGTATYMQMYGGAYVINERQYFRGKKVDDNRCTYDTIEGDTSFYRGIIFAQRQVNNSRLVPTQNADLLILHTGIYIEPVAGATDNIFIFVNGHYKVARHSYNLFEDFEEFANIQPVLGIAPAVKIGNEEIGFLSTYSINDPSNIRGYADKFPEFDNEGAYIQYPDIAVNPNRRGELVFRFVGNPRVLGTDDISTWPGWRMLTDFTVDIIDRRENKGSQTYVYNPVSSIKLNNGFKNTISKNLKMTTQRSNSHRFCTGIIFSNSNMPLFGLYDNMTPEAALASRMATYYKISRNEYDTSVESGILLDTTRYVSIDGKKYIPVYQSINYASDINKIHLNQIIDE